MEIVLDTNVAVVANGKTKQAGRTCIDRCIDQLVNIRDRYCIILDDGDLILHEYGKNLSPSGQPGPGDAFFKWLFENLYNSEYCRKVPLRPHSGREFEEFPSDPALSSFDNDDRKFVAVVLASGSGPEVLNATDTDWWQYRKELSKHGVKVVFLCPELMMVKRAARR